MNKTTENNLQQLAEIFAGSDAAKLRTIMSEDMIFYSESSNTIFK